VLNIRQLVNIVLDSSSTSYVSWRDLMEQALQRYTLLQHVTDDTPSTDPGVDSDGQRRPQLDQQLHLSESSPDGPGTWLHDATPLARHRELVSR
jgi:hypothetical protein